MAWEIWLDSGQGKSYGNMGFFCNTADVCFGQVFYVDSCFDKGDFYEMWEKAGFTDPRKDDSHFESHARRIITLMGYDDNVQVTVKVWNQGKLLYEEARKECYQHLSFSPFQEALEAQSEADFDMICSLMEDCENDMKTVLLNDPDTTTAWMECKYKEMDIRVEMEWEVLDEY
jgi:hypothetical protein